MKDPKGRREPVERQVLLGKMDLKEKEVNLGWQAIRDYLDLWDQRELKETRDFLVHLDPKVSVVKKV